MLLLITPMSCAHDEKFEIRAIIKFLTLERENAKNIHSRICSVLEENVISYSEVARWVSKFKSGCKSIDDEPRSGRPKTATTTENIVKIQEIVDADPRIKLHELVSMTGISYARVFEILHNNLGLSKISARWVPHSLTDEQMQTRVQRSTELLELFNADPQDFIARIVTGDEVWLFHFDPESKFESMQWRKRGSKPPLKVRAQKSAGKVMASIFWDSEGPLLVDYLEHGNTINAEYYSNLMRQLHQSIRYKRPGKLTHGILLLHDNARVHTAARAQAEILNLRFQQLSHPPYSPDMAPSDFYLFRLLKKHLRGQRFTDDEELSTAVENWFSEREFGFYRQAFNELASRWQKCIDARGAYFEKL